MVATKSITLAALAAVGPLASSALKVDDSDAWLSKQQMPFDPDAQAPFHADMQPAQSTDGTSAVAKVLAAPPDATMVPAAQSPAVAATPKQPAWMDIAKGVANMMINSGGAQQHQQQQAAGFAFKNPFSSTPTGEGFKNIASMVKKAVKAMPDPHANLTDDRYKHVDRDGRKSISFAKVVEEGFKQNMYDEILKEDWRSPMERMKARHEKNLNKLNDDLNWIMTNTYMKEEGSTELKPMQVRKMLFGEAGTHRCECLPYNVVYEKLNTTCGDGAEIRTPGLEEACKIYTSLSYASCTNIDPEIRKRLPAFLALKPDAPDQWCYVRKECGDLQGGYYLDNQHSGAAVKVCSLRDDWMYQLPATGVESVAKQNNFDLPVMARVFLNTTVVDKLELKQEICKSGGVDAKVVVYGPGRNDFVLAETASAWQPVLSENKSLPVGNRFSLVSLGKCYQDLALPEFMTV